MMPLRELIAPAPRLSTRVVETANATLFATRPPVRNIDNSLPGAHTSVAVRGGLVVAVVAVLVSTGVAGAARVGSTAQFSTGKISALGPLRISVGHLACRLGPRVSLSGFSAGQFAAILCRQGTLKAIEHAASSMGARRRELPEAPGR